jgi:hypothetical protein
MTAPDSQKGRTTKSQRPTHFNIHDLSILSNLPTSEDYWFSDYLTSHPFENIIAVRSYEPNTNNLVKSPYTYQFWDLDGVNLVSTLRSDCVSYDFMFSSKGTYFALACQDGTIRIFGIQSRGSE